MAQKETVIIDVQTNAAEATEQVDSAVKDLKRSVDETNTALDETSKVGKNSFDKVGDSAEGATKNVDKAKGSLDRFNKSGRETQETVDGAAGVLDEFTGGMASRIKMLATDFKAFGKGAKVAFKTSVAGASSLKKAIIATGIGALVVAVGLLVAYWDDIVGYISGASKEQKDLLAATEKTVAASQQALENTEASENSLKLAGKTEREIRNLKIQQTNELIKQTEIQLAQQKALRESQIAAAERNQKIAAGLIAFISLPITAMLAAIDLASKGLAKLGIISEKTNLVKGLTKGGAKLLGFDPEKVSKEGDEAIAATEVVLRRLKNQRDGYRLQNKNEDEQAAKDAADAAAQAAQDKLDAEAKAAEELAQLKKDIAEAEVNTEEEIRAKELESVAKHYDDLIAAAILNGLETEELEETRQQKLAAIKERHRQQDAAAIKAADDEKVRIAQETADREAAIRDAGYAMVQDSFSALRALSDAFAGESEEQQRRNFAIQKALSSAQVVMGTIEGAQNAFTTAQKSPLTAVFPAYPYVQAGLATAFGIAQLKQIQSQQFESSTPPSTTSASSSGAPANNMAPSFNVVGSSGANVIAESLSKTPLRAYVVGGDVTSQQELDRNRIKSATL